MGFLETLNDNSLIRERQENKASTASSVMKQHRIVTGWQFQLSSASSSRIRNGSKLEIKKEGNSLEGGDHISECDLNATPCRVVAKAHNSLHWQVLMFATPERHIAV